MVKTPMQVAEIKANERMGFDDTTPYPAHQAYAVCLRIGDDRRNGLRLECDLATAQRFRVGATYLVTVEEG